MALTQSHYRFGTADGTESTHGWLAAEDKPTMLPPGRPFLLRICVQADATGLNNVEGIFQYRLTPVATGTPGSWTNVTTTSAVVRTGSTTVFTNGQNCTKRLSGTGTFEASGAGCTHDGSSGGAANDIVANGNSEALIGLQLINADTAIGDLVEFRAVRTGGTVHEAYAVIPAVRVGAEILAAQSRDTSVHFSVTAGAGRVTDNVTTVRCSGMSAADLTDTTLTMTMNVYGTTVQGSTDPADYTVHLYGPEVWVGGGTAKPGSEFAGMAPPPGFAFQQDIPVDIWRVRASFQPSRTTTFGADATIVPVE